VNPVAAPTVHDAPEIPSAAHRTRHRVYLRRYSIQPGRRSYGALIAVFGALACLLFAKVWECTVANSLSMDRDRLRSEVRSLQNRIRLSTELRDQAALNRGIDSETLRGQGFMNPDPARIIDIDLDQPVARAMADNGVVARLNAWLHRAAPPRSAERAPEVEPVSVDQAVGP
jgi:hypothetical protein